VEKREEERKGASETRASDAGDTAGRVACQVTACKCAVLDAVPSSAKVRYSSFRAFFWRALIGPDPR